MCVCLCVFFFCLCEDMFNSCSLPGKRGVVMHPRHTHTIPKTIPRHPRHTHTHTHTHTHILVHMKPWQQDSPASLAVTPSTGVCFVRHHHPIFHSLSLSHTHTHTHAYTHRHAQTHTHKQIRTYTNTHTRIPTHTHTNRYICTHTHTQLYLPIDSHCCIVTHRCVCIYM